MSIPFPVLNPPPLDPASLGEDKVKEKVFTSVENLQKGFLKLYNLTVVLGAFLGAPIEQSLIGFLAEDSSQKYLFLSEAVLIIEGSMFCLLFW